MMFGRLPTWEIALSRDIASTFPTTSARNSGRYFSIQGASNEIPPLIFCGSVLFVLFPVRLYFCFLNFLNCWGQKDCARALHFRSVRKVLQDQVELRTLVITCVDYGSTAVTTTFICSPKLLLLDGDNVPVEGDAAIATKRSSTSWWEYRYQHKEPRIRRRAQGKP